MDIEEDDAISIDHLIGEPCVLNSTLMLTLNKNSKKGGRLELVAPGETQFLLIESIDDLSADGGFVVTVRSPKGIYRHQLSLITAALFSHNSKELKKTKRRSAL